ncbi:MAG: dienelactone hydrolase family protein [Anaerolineae bacterium]|nr:dienelactone hydrolase family protein [Anaerolineae bacterium]
MSPGDVTRTLTHAGRERSYIVHVPPGYDPARATPVVLVFHGGGGYAENARTMTGFDAVADAEGFIVVYPNGTGRRSDRLLTWNGGRCCGYAMEQNVDDVGFVRALLADLEAIANVDARRIYATGMSNGAIMSYRLACELADVIAAIGPVAATQNLDACTPSRPVPVLHIHGDADKHAPYAGGVGAESLVGIPFEPVETTIEFWVGHNGCASTPQVTQNGSIRHTVYNGCQQDAAVELYTVVGSGHAWPGGQPGWKGGDVPTTELNASQVIWDFFAAHPHP